MLFILENYFFSQFILKLDISFFFQISNHMNFIPKCIEKYININKCILKALLPAKLFILANHYRHTGDNDTWERDYYDDFIINNYSCNFQKNIEALFRARIKSIYSWNYKLFFSSVKIAH